MKHITLILALCALSTSASEALWLRDVKISPDGKQIAFTYKGDIYLVPSSGGSAHQLTTTDTYESHPVWNPDGTRLAYASDMHGNFDVFIIDADGANPQRLTSNSASEIPEAFTPDGSSVLFSAAIQNPAKSAMFPSSRMTELYSVPANGGKPVQILGTPAQAISFTPDGAKMLYQDIKGFEDQWRKHHTSSDTRDIWMYDLASGTHTNITNRPGEDRDPVVTPDGNTLIFLSERDGGTFNLWATNLDNPDKTRAITSFTTHPVRFLSQATNGALAFTYNGEIYTMSSPNAKPQKITVDVPHNDRANIEKSTVKPSQSVVSPDGKSIAFISRGDVFVTSVEYPTTVQVTHTPAAESHISWGADNRSLYYTTERSGRKNIYKAIMARKDDPNLPNATSIAETPMFDVAVNELTTPTAEYSHPLISPDGKKMAYVKNRNEIWVKNLKTGAEKQLTKGETYPQRNDGIYYEWAPDSRWMVAEITPKMRDPYSDVGLIDTETGSITNITQSGYFCEHPHFVLDGNAVIFFTDRYGKKAQASWGSEDDIMIAFLNRAARDRFNLSEEDFALLKDAEKAAEKNDETARTDGKDSNKKKGKDDKKTAKTDKSDTTEKAPKTLVVELDGIEDRIQRLTPYSSSLADAIISADGDKLYYLSAFEDGYDLWSLKLRKSEPKLVNKTNISGSVSLQADKDGKNIFILAKTLQKLDPKSDKLTSVKVDYTQAINTKAEREAMYDFVTVEEMERFYDVDMHGVDWKLMTDAYRRFLPHINNNYDFAELLSELLGELNVSHTGGRYRPATSRNADKTASLGLLYDLTFTGNGLKVDEVLADGPFDKASSKMLPGSIITAIDNQPLTTENDFSDLLTDRAGKKTLVAFITPDGKSTEEVVIPVGSGVISDLLYKRWIRQRAADVDRLSGGRLGYVHIASMNDASFRPMYADLLGKYNNREGVIIDIRWNGGGRMHEDIEQLFTGQKYLTQVVRGIETCDMPSRRWNKPSVMLVAEPCYSNAHGTPWVFQHQHIGKVIGAPVPGTMTSVNWVTMQDPSLVFGIPVVGYRTDDGNYLENTQLEPDVLVLNSPETIVKGEDTQLRIAVETLLRDIDAAK